MATRWSVVMATTFVTIWVGDGSRNLSNIGSLVNQLVISYDTRGDRTNFSSDKHIVSLQWNVSKEASILTPQWTTTEGIQNFRGKRSQNSKTVIRTSGRPTCTRRTATSRFVSRTHPNGTTETASSVPVKRHCKNTMIHPVLSSDHLEKQHIRCSGRPIRITDLSRLVCIPCHILTIRGITSTGSSWRASACIGIVGSTRQ